MVVNLWHTGHSKLFVSLKALRFAVTVLEELSQTGDGGGGGALLQGTKSKVQKSAIPGSEIPFNQPHRELANCSALAPAKTGSTRRDSPWGKSPTEPHRSGDF